MKNELFDGDAVTEPKRCRKVLVAWNEKDRCFEVECHLLKTWERDFPGIDVVAEIRKAGQWHAASR